MLEPELISGGTFARRNLTQEPAVFEPAQTSDWRGSFRGEIVGIDGGSRQNQRLVAGRLGKSHDGGTACSRLRVSEILREQNGVYFMSAWEYFSRKCVNRFEAIEASRAAPSNSELLRQELFSAK